MTDKKNFDIEKEVDEAMDYLQRMETIELDHHFDARVIAAAGARHPQRVGALRLKPAFVVLLILINLLSLLYFSGIIPIPPQRQEQQYPRYVKAMETVYSMEQNDYDLKLMEHMDGVKK